MRCAVIANSGSGNTRLVAQAIVRELECAGEVALIGDSPFTLTAGTVGAAVETLDAADAVVLGFWCDKGTCAPVVDELLPHLAGKRVFLFGTAGFGADAAYFERILSGVRAKLPSDAVYVGGAMCQGKMGPGVRRRYEAMLAADPADERARQMIDNFDAALPHPTQQDCERIASLVAGALIA